MNQTRRLAAILAADVAGYSRLIGADEEGTLNRRRSLRVELVDPTIAEHRGRIVKTTGDGFLVEFSSVIDALRCATQWQHEWPLYGATIASSSASAFTRATSFVKGSKQSCSSRLPGRHSSLLP
jgi:adenylate cyclase